MTMLHQFVGHKPIDGVYWTLVVEIGFYFLISLLIAYKLLPHLRLICLLWLLYVASVGPTPPIVTPFYLLFIADYAPYFVAGMLFYLLQNQNGKIWQLYALLGFSYVLAIRQCYGGMAALSAAVHEPFSFWVASVAVTLFFVTFFLFITRILNLQRFQSLSKLGALTYPLYVTHAVIGYIAFQHLGGILNKYIILIILIASMLMLAWVINTFVEKKFSKLLGRKVEKVLEIISATTIQSSQI